MKLFRRIFVTIIAATLVCMALPVYAAEEPADSEYGIATLAVTTSNYKTTWKGTTYYHDPNVAAGKNILPGIDVSQYQGTINWSKVAADGIQFAFIRLGYTSQYDQSINLDSCFKANIEGAKAAGIKVGVYYRSQARTKNEAVKEAEFAAQQLKNYSLDLPVAVDYEYYDGGTVSHTYPDKATKTAALNAFCDTVSAAGYRAIMYLNTDILANDVNAGNLNYSLWLARWTTGVPEYSGSYEFWQCCGGGASVNGISGAVDLDWWYTTATDIVKNASGKWIYTVNGEPDYTYTGVAKNKNGWWYVKDGIVDFSYTGFAKNSNGKWYVKKGKVDFSVNSVLKDTTGAIGDKGTWYYVVGSKVQTGFTGLADYKNSNGWWYIKNGKVDFTANTVAKNKNGWWYIKGGKVRFSYNGFAENSNGKWYCKSGKVDFSVNNVLKDTTGAIGKKGTWYYVVGSKVQTGFTGLADYRNGNGWWYIKNGKVDFTANTVAKNKNGWWYIEGGKVRFSYNGFAENGNGKWYCKNGKVDFRVNSVIKDTAGVLGKKGTWYYVVRNRVQTGFTGLADYKNGNGWWYITNGKVDFTYNGIAQNRYGWWYIKNGAVDFTFNGTIQDSGTTCQVTDGKVDR